MRNKGNPSISNSLFGCCRNLKDHRKNQRVDLVCYTAAADNKDELSATPVNATATKATNNSTVSEKEDNEPSKPTFGIGGQGGVRYNVNPLKRNLVQETVRQYKQELVEDLLSSGSTMPSDAGDSIDSMGDGTTGLMSNRPSLTWLQRVESRLAALVQANPVSCTTDSNFLDGDRWTFAFRSSTAASTLLDTRRFSSFAQNYEASSSTSSPSKSGKTSVWMRLFNPNSARGFHLETLEEDEDPFVVDEIRFPGGVLERKQIYSIQSLSRTSLDLVLMSSQWCFLGRRIRRSKASSEDDAAATRKTLQILYLDSDLCVMTEQGMNAPFSVYSRNVAWIDRTRLLRKNLISPIRGSLSFIRNRFQRRREFPINRSLQSSKSVIMDEIRGSQGVVKAKVVQLGERNAIKQDEAWEGDQDPFMGLDADERQAVLKTMKLNEVEEAGRSQQAKARQANSQLKKKMVPIKEFKRAEEPLKPFKKPDDE